MIRNLGPKWIMFLNIFFCNTIKVNYFCVIILQHCYKEFLSLFARSLLVLYVYASIEFAEDTLLSLLALNAILLTCSVNTLRFLLRNICCDFTVILLFFYEFFMTVAVTIYLAFQISCF